jgi:hypothetical protein
MIKQMKVRWVGHGNTDRREGKWMRGHSKGEDERITCEFSVKDWTYLAQDKRHVR